MANVHSVEPMASLYSAIRLAASAFPSALTRTPGSMACSLWSNADKTDLGSSDASGSTLKRRMVFSKRLGSSCMRSLSHAWRLAWLLRDSGREISYGGHVLPSSSLTRPWTHSSIGTCASESFFSPLTMSTSERSASSTTPGVRSEVKPAVAADAPPPPPPPPPPLPLPLVAAVPAPPPPIAALRACSAALAASKGSDPSSSSAGGSAIARCGGIEAGVVILSSSSLLSSSSVRVSVVVLVVVLVGDGASSSTTGLTGLPPPPPPRPPRPPLLVGRACDALPLSVAAAGGGGGDLDTAARAAGLGADGGPGLGGTGFLPSLSVAILGAGFGLPFLSPEAVAVPSMASGNGAGSSPSSSDTTSSSSSDSEGFMSLAMRFERTRSLGHEAFPTFAALERLAQHAPQESSRVHARTLPHARGHSHTLHARLHVSSARIWGGGEDTRAPSQNCSALRTNACSPRQTVV